MELLNKKITEQQQQQQLQQSQPPVAAALGINPQQAETVAGVARPTRERQVIWQGVLEWQEKTRDPQKLPRHVPCQVSASVTNGESEVSVLLLYFSVSFFFFF
jgi:mediator of RNA polymerase II transcription subunit 25